MTVLFDECVPRPLRLLLTGHLVKTARQMGWARRKNGALLALAEEEFEVFVTCDQNLSYQQNLAGRRLAILVLSTNHWPTLRACAAQIDTAIGALKPGDFLKMDLGGEHSAQR